MILRFFFFSFFALKNYIEMDRWKNSFFERKIPIFEKSEIDVKVLFQKMHNKNY